MPSRSGTSDAVCGGHSSRANAFTLIELLVVVAILGMLAALLLPTLAIGKAAARRIKCVGNLRQLGLAAQMYWDDNSGNCFRYRGVSTNGGDVYWFGWLARGAEGARAFDASLGALHPYLGGRGVEVCPAMNYWKRDFKLKATGAAFGYGYNLQLSAPLDRPLVNISRLARATELAFLGDAAQVNTFQSPASPSNPLLEEFYYLSTNEPTAHFRHTRHTASVLFCDGHVASERPVEGSLDNRMPQYWVGRVRTAILVLP